MSYVNHDRVNVMNTQVGFGANAQYRLLQPHFFNTDAFNVPWYDINSIITEGIDVPRGWLPTLAVDPLNNSAVAQFYNAGPRDIPTTTNDISLFEHLVTPLAFPSVTHWLEIKTGHNPPGIYLNHDQINVTSIPRPGPQAPGMWKLTGLGASYPPRKP